MTNRLRFPSLILALLLLTAGFALAESGPSEAAVEPTNYACVSDGQVYLLENDTLYEADATLGKTKELFRFDSHVSGLSVDDSIAYYCLQDDSTAAFGALNLSTMEQNELFTYATTRPLFEMLVHDQTIFALWEYTFDELMERSYNFMCVATAHELDGQPVDLPFTEASSIVPSSRYGLLVAIESHSDSDAFFSYDSQAHILQALSAQGGAINMAVGAGDIVYTRNYDGVYRYDTMEGQPSIVEMLEDGNTQTGLICTEEYLIRYSRQGDWDMQKWPINPANAEKGRTLTLVNCYNILDERLNYAVKQLQAAHPDVEVRFETLEGDALRTALLAQDSSLDILFTDSYDGQTYLDANILWDLNQDPALAEELQTFMGISAMTRDGRCFGAPVEYSWNCLIPNEALAEYAPEIDPENLDWIEFLRLAEQFNPDIDGDGRNDLSFLYALPDYPPWTTTYEALFDDPSQIRYDTETFRTLVESYKRCVNAGLVQFDNADTALFRHDSILSIQTNVSTVYRIPMLEGNRSMDVFAFFLGLLKSSANPDLAMEFLRYYCSDEAASQCFGIGLKSDSQLYPQYSELDPEQIKSVDLQKSLLNNAETKPSIDASFSVFTAEQLTKYYADEITLDELISNLQSKLSMMVLG